MVKVGDRVEIVTITDTWTKLEKGSRGTVFKIENSSDEPLIWVNWDSGETLALIEGIDKYKIIKK